MAQFANRRSFREVCHLPAYHPLLPAIATQLTRACATGDAARAARVPGQMGGTVFDGEEPAPTSPHDYLVRICKYGHCSRWAFVCAWVYIQRFCAATGARLSSHNIHRLLITSFVTAAKLRDDTYFANNYYASIGGVSLRDMNKMEAIFLTALNWRTHIDPAEFDAAESALMQASKQAGEAPGKTQPPQLVDVIEAVVKPTSRKAPAALPTDALATKELSPDVDDLGAGSFCCC